MGNSWQVLPSPRPLLLWFGADAVCVALLTALALALLAFWRRSSRPWWLGMASLIASWLGIIATVRVYRAYHEITPFARYCSSPYDCAVSSQTILDAVAWVGLLSSALVAVTLAALLTATGLWALEWGRQASARAGADGASGWKARLAALVLAGPFTSLGVFITAQGAFDWSATAYLAYDNNAGDGIGLIPLINAIFTTIVGAGLLIAGLILLSRTIGSRFLRRERLPLA